jgi:predicted acyltransferase
MAGSAMLLLSAFYYIIDIKGYQAWSKFFVIIGSNAVFIYFLRVSGIFDFNQAASFFTSAIEPHVGPWAQTLHALAFIAILWTINAFLYSKKIFIKA